MSNDQRFCDSSSTPSTSSAGTYQHGKFRYRRPPARLVFPEEEKVPESLHHIKNRTALWQSADAAFGHKAAVGSDQFLYWDCEDPGKNLAPDLMVSLSLSTPPESTWKVWEIGRPDLAVELVSKSDRPKYNWLKKLRDYKLIGIRELVRFDPKSRKKPLRVWDWCEGDLIERVLENPLVAESTILPGTYFVVVAGEKPALRLAQDPEGKLLWPTPEESQKEAELRASEAELRASEAERSQKEAELRAERAQKEADLRAAQAEFAVRRQVLKTLLSARGLSPTPEEAATIDTCSKTEVFDRWLAVAVSAPSVAAVLAA